MTREVFDKKTLLDQMESYYESVREGLRQYTAWVNADDYEERVKAWRNQCQEYLLDVAQKLKDDPGSVTDNDLDNFDLPERPERRVNRYITRQIESDLLELDGTKERALAYVMSLKEGEDGTLHLLKSQVNERVFIKFTYRRY